MKNEKVLNTIEEAIEEKSSSSSMTKTGKTKATSS